MRWRVVPKVKNPEEWNLFFAVKPVQIGDYKYTLCWLLRRAIYAYDDCGRNTGEFIRWEYDVPVVYY